MRDFDTTPRILQGQAKGFLALYRSAIESEDYDEQHAGIFCLFLSLELYLKAYLSLKDNRFSQEVELKRLGHNLNSILNEVSRFQPTFLADLEKILVKYNLSNNNYTELRYIKNNTGVIIHQDLLNGNHGFDEVFRSIDNEISTWNYEN